MSVVNSKQTNLCQPQSGRVVELPAPIQEKLAAVSYRDWQAELIRSVALVVGFLLLSLITLLVADALFVLRWPPLRWGIWLTALIGCVGLVKYLFIKSRRNDQPLVDAAWKIESSHPAMEERLTSTVQFFEDKSGYEHHSLQLIDALAAEANDGVQAVDTESIQSQSYQGPIAVAGVLSIGLAIAVAIWPQPVMTSFGNLAAPWSAYKFAKLPAKIVPGDVVVSAGEAVHIEVLAATALHQPTLEIVHDDGIESRSMVLTSPQAATLALNDVTEDTVYRIRSAGRYSGAYSIKVRPRPQLNSISAQLIFPEYTGLDPVLVEPLLEPIEVPAGTQVTLKAEADTVAVSGLLRWDSVANAVVGDRVRRGAVEDSIGFEWSLQVKPDTQLVGTLQVQSDFGVGSTPHRLEIRAVKDAAPEIELTVPGLRQLTMRRDARLPISYQVIEDFGVAKTELMVMYGDQEPVSLTCPTPDKQANANQVWNGTTSLELAKVPADCSTFSIWLRVADNRPDEFGGAQVAESERISVTLDALAESLGQQQILSDRQLVEQSLQRAIDQIQSAQSAAEALQDKADRQDEIAEQELADNSDSSDALADQEADSEPGVENPGGSDQQSPIGEKRPTGNQDPGVEAGRPSTRNDHLETLRQQTANAKQTLDQLSERLKEESNLFESIDAEIQQVADREVTDALELANQIPLADNQSQQDELALAAKQDLASAKDQLNQLKSDLARQADQMEAAAKLEQLASRQEQLAEEVAAGEQDSEPDEQWRQEQTAVAEELQAMADKQHEAKKDEEVQQGNEAQQQEKVRQEQLLKQADAAEQLAQQAEQLAKQQQQLEQAVQDAQKNDDRRKQAQQQLQDIIAAQQEEIDQHAQPDQANDEPDQRPDQEAREAQKQRLEAAADAVENGDLDDAASKVQQQIAEQTEQLKQQAEQFAEQQPADPAAQKQAEQAAQQLQQAQQQTQRAQQSLCEKCNSGGNANPQQQGKSNSQDTGDQNSSSKQDQPAEPQGQAKQHPAAQPGNAGQQEPASNNEDAQFQRAQQDAADSLQQAAQSLKQVCQSCRECAECNNPGASEGANPGKSGGSGKPGASPGSQQLAEARDGAEAAANSPSKRAAAKGAEQVAQQLNELADNAARESGYHLGRQNVSSQQQQGGEAGQDGMPGQPSNQPGGVGTEDSDTNLNGQQLRGGSNSNWTRSQRKLDGGVLNDQEGNVPEQFKDVVDRYFEELSRQQSNRNE